MRRVYGLCAVGLASVLVARGNRALGQLQAPAGYQVIPLVDSSDQPFSPSGLAVNAITGALAVTNGSTVTLYNTWQNGRSVVASATDSAWLFDTDPVFVNPTTIVFGENGNTDALWEVNFATPTPTITQITANNSLPAVQGVALTSPTTALVSGTTAAFGSTGGLYLDSVNLAETSNNVSTVVSNVGTGYVGDPGVSPAGSNLLPEDSATSAPSVVHVYSNTGSSEISLADGNGFGAYAIAFDSAGIAYVTTEDTITAISGIDSSSPVVSQFASDPATADNPYPFLASISYTGGGFDPNGPPALQTGALIVNDADAGQAYAIVVPEPASVGVLGTMCAIAMLRRRKAAR